MQPGRAHATVTTGGEADRERPAPLPWHLKLLAGALVVYLGFRAWQGIDLIIHAL